MKEDIFDFSIRPTLDTSEEWQRHYEVFNEELFDYSLPNCRIIFERRQGTFGYFTAETLQRGDGKFCDEIALNPSLYDPEHPIGLLSTLGHEMVHVWQFHFGTPGRGRYHNREWANKMIAIGLQPSATGKPGGRETGDAMHHFVIPDGPFELSARRLIESGPVMTWIDCPPEQPQQQSLKSIIEETSQPAIDEEELENADLSNSVVPEPVSKNGKKFRFKCPEHEFCKTSVEGSYDQKVTCTQHQLELVMVPRKKRQPGEGLPLK